MPEVQHFVRQKVVYQPAVSPVKLEVSDRSS